MAENTWESAKSETMKTCWPEINSEQNLKDISTSGAFEKAKIYIKKNTWFLSTQSGQLDKYWVKILEAIKKWGESACGDIAKALDNTSFKKEIPDNIIAKIPENTPGIRNTPKESFPSIQSTARTLWERGKNIDNAIAASGG